MRSILLFTSQIKISCISLQPVLIWEIFGGGKRDRTDDPLLAKQVLYQLSYAPSTLASSLISLLCLAVCMVGLVGLEPTTPRLSSVCSNHLSYKPLGLYFFFASLILQLTDKCECLTVSSFL